MSKRGHEEEPEYTSYKKQQKSVGKDSGREHEWEQRDTPGKNAKETVVHPNSEQLRDLRVARYSRPGLDGKKQMGGRRTKRRTGLKRTKKYNKRSRTMRRR